jgi:hypothetical protein
MAKCIVTQASMSCLEVRNIFREISRLQSNRSHSKEYEAILFSEIRNVNTNYIHSYIYINLFLNTIFNIFKVA